MLSEIHGRHPAIGDLTDQDFSSLDEVLRLVGRTDETIRTSATEALARFCPSLILNRTTGARRVNTLHLKNC